ncbi:hypothetical protein HDU79_003244 [Rhizoclosmatium sp. JEL0117]|nr:hypothetical protein HDU79_003244 [Rhizoclosmatium sp. JEL0117]
MAQAASSEAPSIESHQVQKKPKPSTKTQAQTQWQNVLSQYLTSPESFTSAVVVKATEKVVVINDAFPKAKLHFLLLPRIEGHSTAAGIAALESKDLEMLEMLKGTVEELRNNHPDATLRAGFHAIPSMAHLHLHLISDDFISPALKNKKHWNSFTTPFFVPLDKVIDEVTRNGCIKVDKEANEWLLKGPLVCHKCQQTLKNIPDLKRHLEIHVESKHLIVMPPQSSFRAGLLSLPPELLTEILILLPIDEKVVDVGLSCKRLAQFIFATYSFARMHFQHQHTVYRLSGVTPYLALKFGQLPFNYQTGSKAAKQNGSVNVEFSSYNGCKSSSSAWIKAVTLLMEYTPLLQSNILNAGLLTASMSGQYEICRILLLDGRADPTRQNCALLSIMVSLDHIQTFKVFLADKRFDPTCHLECAVICCDMGSLDVYLKIPRVNTSAVNYLLGFSVKINNRLAVMRLLEDTRVNPSFNENYALKAAAQNGYWDIVSCPLQDTRIVVDDEQKQT